jgi:hypothetical protein
MAKLSVTSQLVMFCAVLLTAVVMITACSPKLDATSEAKRNALIGTWEAVTEDIDAQYRETITLKSDGTFNSNNLRTKGSTHARFSESGEWHLHGGQFKRHYKIRDGQPISKKEQGYLTLEIINKIGADSFQAKDNINGTTTSFKKI